jgi:integral membrane protein
MTLKFSKTPLGRFRLIGMLEGTSFLLLLLIAMPLKYLADMPLPVKYTGWAHGVLFILYIISLAQVKFANKWGLLRVFVAFIASLLPFGTFILDLRLRKEEEIILKS